MIRKFSVVMFCGLLLFLATQGSFVERSFASSNGVGSIAEIVNTVSLRTRPSTTSDRIRYLQQGEHVTLLEKVNSYWYKIQDKMGTVGYTSTNTKYITILSVTMEKEQEQEQIAGTAIENVIQTGLGYLGTPYEFGSSRLDNQTFDCSDFVRVAFKEAIGLVLPASSRTQADYVRSKHETTTDWKNLRRGDLMFFMSYKGSSESNYRYLDKTQQRITHVGIYMGNGQVLHTYSIASGGVRVDSIINRHWEYRFLFGGSAL
jgi:cell wall-associated NlpC family hydrolase